jgi:hypothetical protein
MSFENTGYKRPEWFRFSDFYKKLRESEVNRDLFMDNVGTIPDETPEQLWPKERPLTPKEVDDALRMNKLRRLYLEWEKWEILQLGDINTEVNDNDYWDFVMLLVECYERLGEKYVNHILAPLGFKQQYYVTNKRIR